MDKLGEGSMTLNEHAHIQRKSERFGEIRYPFGLMFTTTIGEENKGNPIPLQERESFSGSWESCGAAEQNAIDATGTFRKALI